MKLGFHMGYSSLSEKNYGSEIALINLAKQFQNYYDVTIYSSNCLKDGTIEGITYRRPDPVITDDILIISRYLNVFVDHTIKSEKVYIWVHDMTFQPYYNGQQMKDNGAHLFANIEKMVDGIIVLTEFHKNLMKRQYAISDKKIHMIGNGILTERFNRDVVKDKYKFIYTSCPKRGLDLLLKIFPMIHSEFPEAKLYIYRGNESFNKEQLDEIAKYPYIHYMGEKPNDVIIDEFLSSGVWLYPTNFLETYCISALEAQMAGCLCITSNIASLPEIVGNRGVIITSPYNSPEYIEDVLKSVRIFLKTDLYDNKIRQAKKWASEQSWEKITDKWLKFVREELPITSYVINLKRQPEKWDICREQLQKAGLRYERFEGVDGNDLEWNSELQKYFVLGEDNYKYLPHKNNVGVFGCAMSHIRLWEKIAQFSDDTVCIIMEDDLVLHPGFTAKFKKAYESIKDDNRWDILYIGYLFFQESLIETDLKITDNIYHLQKSEKRWDGGGTHCYCLRASGAKKILEIIKTHKVHRAIDWFLIDYYDKITAYLIYPMICNQDRKITSSVQGGQKTLKGL